MSKEPWNVVEFRKEIGMIGLCRNKKARSSSSNHCPMLANVYIIFLEKICLIINIMLNMSYCKL
jgi:hypothetical protein